MSVNQKSNILVYTCEGCGKSHEFEAVNPTPETISAMSKYFTIARNVVDQGQTYQLKVQACSIDCVPAAALKLLAVPSDGDEQTDGKIDLASLQLNGPKN
jgi:transcription elongation factor Elf1